MYSHDGVKNLCKDLSFYENDPLSGFARWVRYAFSNNGQCFNFSYDNLVNQGNTTEWNTSGTRSGRKYNILKSIALFVTNII